MLNRYLQSSLLFEKASRITPGAVHSSQRYFRGFPFFNRAKGSKVQDADGNEYIDYHLAFGSVILGHNHPAVVRAVKAQLETGDTWGLGSNELEYKVAGKITRHVPSAEMVRFCNSGSEATYHAVRLARAFTKRKKLLKFEGAYHGWHDYLDVNVSTPLKKAQLSHSESEGSLQEASQQTLVAPYNDFAEAKKIISAHRNELAAVFVEPILHNCGIIMPEEGFLEGLREFTEKYGIILVFDEVITGFRHGLGGAQQAFGVTPDLTTLGKAFANGFPAAAICGRQDLMNQIKPIGGVDVSGTYSGHPISMAAALASIGELEKGIVYRRTTELCDLICRRLSSIIEDLSLDAQVQHYRSIFTLYFTRRPIHDYGALAHNNEEMFQAYCKKLREDGILITPSSRKRCHLSGSHSKDDVRRTLEPMEKILPALKARRR